MIGNAASCTADGDRGSGWPLATVILVVLAALMTAASARVPDRTRSSLAGDWAGWVYLDAGGDAPIRLHVRSTEAGTHATFDFPASRSFEEPLPSFRSDGSRFHFERTSSGGTHQGWTGVLDGNDVHGELSFDGEPVGMFELHRSEIPLPNVDPDTYADCVGIYPFDSGRTVVITPRFWGELLYLDTETGRFGTLFATSDSTFFAGSAMYVPAPVTARATCRSATEAAPGALVWHDEGRSERATRIQPVDEDLEFRSGDVTIRGTLIRPPGPGPHPAAVILGGSSWTIRGSLRSDADVLVSAGIAALIYDKRGFGESTGDDTVPFEETAADARAAVRYLKGRADVRADAIGLTGRSRGGWFAPLAASRSADVAFLVLFVAPAISPAEQETTRRLNALRSRGVDEAGIELARAYLDELWRYARTGERWEEYAAARARIEAKGWLDVLQGPATPAEGWDWMRMNMFYDPVPALERLKVPVLALFGAEDENVTPEQNVPLMRAALRRAGNPDVTLRVIPNVDHSLRIVQEAGTPLHRRVGYGPEVWSTVLDWLAGRVGSEGAGL